MKYSQHIQKSNSRLQHVAIVLFRQGVRAGSVSQQRLSPIGDLSVSNQKHKDRKATTEKQSKIYWFTYNKSVIARKLYAVPKYQERSA